MRIPTGGRAFWSHGAEREAGVGLWLKRTFIERVCGKDNEGRVIEVEEGRALVWRGGGEEGKFQIGVVYVHAGNSAGRKERQASRKC